MTLYPSTLHKHSAKCRVPLTDLFLERPPGATLRGHDYRFDRAEDGRPYVEVNRMYAAEGCSELKIPIFLPARPSWIPRGF